MTQSESRLVKRCLFFGRAASIAAIGIGSLVLVGWLLDISFLKSVLPAAATMKPNTAACFVLAGLGLWLRMGSDQSGGLSAQRFFAARACAAAVALVGLLTLSEYLLNVNLGIDEALFREALLATPNPNPGRMAFATALATFVLGMALLFLDVEPIRGHRLSPSLALLTALIGLVALLGYIYGVQALYHFSAYSSMALHTSALFMLLGVGVLCARPTWGVMATLTSEHSGGWMMRRVLPVAFTLPFVIGWLRLAGEKAGLYETEFGLTLFAASNIAIFAAVIWLNARALNRVDARRRQTEEAVTRSAQELQHANERLQREIAERRLAGEALLDSEKRFRALIENTSDVVALLGSDGTIQYASPAITRMMGYAVEEYVGRSGFEFIHADDVADATNAFARILQQPGLSAVVQARERHSDGSWRWLEGVATNLLLEPSVQSIVVNFRDITERKQAEEELRESEARLYTAIENLPFDFWACDAEGRYTMQNTRSIQRWGNLIGKHLEDADLSEEFLTEWRSARQRALAGEIVRSEQAYTVAGQTRYAFKTLAPIRAGARIRGALGITFDITELKRAEAEIHRLNAELNQRIVERTTQLQESEEKFSKAFLASPAGMSIASAADGRYLDVNEALAHMTGYSREELIGHTSVELGLVDADARAKILQSAQTYGSVRDVEIQVYTKSKQVVEALVSIERIELGGQACLLTIQYDITARKRAEAEIRRLNQELEQRQFALETVNQELDAFAYSVSHDLRAPLRAIDGYSRLVVEDYADKLNAEGHRLLNVVRASTRKMDALITDVLALARCTRSEMRWSRIDMTALADSVYQDIASPEVQHKIVFSVAPLPDAYGDPTLLRQVWSNLISNAIKYTLPKDERRIDIGGYTEPGMNIYFVKDTGVGFNPDYAHKLFGMFQRLHREEEFEGTGVGLAIVQRIVQRHGGHAWAEGQINQGATIYFSVPQASDGHE